jgi:hypothetical protein
MEHTKADKHDGEAEDGKYFTHVELNNPAKPMNAKDKHPAMMKIRAVPLATSGMSANSVFSRIDAMRTSANVRPNPAPTANAIPSRKPYSRFVWKMAKPRMAQFVVINGR